MSIFKEMGTGWIKAPNFLYLTISPLSISVYISKTMDIIQVLVAYKLHNYKQVSTLQGGVNCLYKQTDAIC